MEKFSNINDFFSYINKPLNNDDIIKSLKEHNIIIERVAIYYDFTLSLVELIYTTYLGDDIIKSVEDKNNHYNWCFNKTVMNFKSYTIDFSGNKELYNYFKFFVNETFYNDKNKTDELNYKLLTLWEYVFDFNKDKSKSDIDSFIEVYKIFNRTVEIKLLIG